jgi:uncharacterized membrane protein
VRTLSLLVIIIASATLSAQGVRFEVIDLTAQYGLSPSAGLVDINASGTMVGGDQGQAIMIENGKLSVLERPKGAIDYFASAINDDGVILGRARFSAPEPQKSVIWVNGKAIMPNLTPAVGNLSYGPLNALNNLGTFAGTDHSGPSPILWSEGKGVSYLPHPPGSVGGVSSINDAGVSVGVLRIGDLRASKWTNGIYSDLHPAGYISSRAEGIAANGDVGGYVTTSNAFHGGFWRYGTEFVDIGTFTSTDYTWFSDLNSHEQMVGQATLNGQFAAYFWEKGELHNLADLVDPGLNISFGNATAIDELGNIIASGTLNGLVGRKMLLRPVPEPSTFLGISVCVGVFAVLRRRHL